MQRHHRVMPVIIGTPGWQYDSWWERFYPRSTAQAHWLEHYSARFDAVESNNAFYRLPDLSTFGSSAHRTPTGFMMAVKVSRFLTHVKRLREPAEPVDRFVRCVAGLGSKLGPVSLPLAPTMRADAARFRDTLECFPVGMRVAVEFRHESWETDEVRTLLADRGAALCLAARGGPLKPLWRTADWGYIRFHEGRSRPSPCYGRRALATWSQHVATMWPSDAYAFAYFNDDPLACPARDARWFAQEVRKVGLSPSRVPRPESKRMRDLVSAPHGAVSAG